MTATPTSGPASPSASLRPDLPGSIVFSRYDTAIGADGPYLGIFIIDAVGGRERPIRLPSQAEAHGAGWSPDGTRLVATILPPAGPVRPAILAADGSAFERLDDIVGVDGYLGCTDWSRTDDRLVCEISGYAPEPDGIYLLRPADGALERLTESPFHYTEGTVGGCGGGDGRAMASPDGTRIAFIRQRCGSGANPAADESAAIEVMRLDGTDLREIVPQGRVKSHPGGQLSWAPDSRTISFGSQEGELYVVDVATRAITPIPIPEAVGRHHAWGPDWSPDGSRLVFSMFVSADGTADLYTIAPDGSELRRVTTAEGAESWARWGPAEP